MTEPRSPWWQRFTTDYNEYIRKSEARLRQQQDVCNGWAEGHMRGLWTQDEADQGEQEYRVLVHRRLAKPMAE